MRNKKKKRCINCLMFHSDRRTECPYCGYTSDNGFSQSIHDALPLCSLVGRLRIGQAVQTEKNRITYIGLDTVKNKRILIDEFFPHGYVQRQKDGQILLSDSTYTDIVEQEKKIFLKKGKAVLHENGSVYRYRRLFRKSIRSVQKTSRQNSVTLRSIIGSRANQEDSADFKSVDRCLCAVLCDGMGGINGGETASSECVRIMLETVDTIRYCNEGILPFVLKRQAIQADQYISSLQDMDERRLQCGTTLLYVVIRDERMYFVSVGDSHIYLIHENAIQLLSEEHNYLSDLMQKVANHEMDYEDAVTHPKREALTSYIGIGNLSKMHIPATPISLQEGDHVLLCSDGLYRTLHDEELLRIITENRTVEAAADSLIKTVEERNLPKQDNTTFILYQHTGRKRK